MKKLLLPLAETDRSLKALNYIVRNYSPVNTEVAIVLVDEDVVNVYARKNEEEAEAIARLNEKAEAIAEALPGFRVTKRTAVGNAGVRIVRAAREVGADLIVMTKSAKDDMQSLIGTTADYVINNAPCEVLIVSEAVNKRNEYRGLVYKTASGDVTLRGQLGSKQSECLLPSVNIDCIYTVKVTVGAIRFYHSSYNPDTRSWDLPPQTGQEARVDVAAGETARILVKADSVDGKADRIRIVNRNMRDEAVFSYRISAAQQ